jgi:hypothetical protein
MVTINPFVVPWGRNSASPGHSFGAFSSAPAIGGVISQAPRGTDLPGQPSAGDSIGAPNYDHLLRLVAQNQGTLTDLLES